MAAAEKHSTIVSTKGQIILPQAIREQRHWQAGTRLVGENTEDGVLLRAAPLFAPTRQEYVFASLPYEGPPKTPAAMEAEAKRRHARHRY
jgi:AbrB family looped-hinge helix DNA binding protein